MATGDNGRPLHPNAHAMNTGFGAFLETLNDLEQPEHVRAVRVMDNVPFSCDSCRRSWRTASPVEIVSDDPPVHIFLCHGCAGRLADRLKAS